jgi:hypothetical protein
MHELDLKERVLATLEELERAEPEWRKLLLGLYDQGAADPEVMRALSLSPRSWELLIDSEDTEFGSMVEFGQLLSQAWWLTQGRINLTTRNFNTSLYSFQMKNRFEWTDKTEQSIKGLDYKNTDNKDLAKEVDDLLAALNEAHS